jgi:hypothetical protein
MLVSSSVIGIILSVIALPTLFVGRAIYELLVFRQPAQRDP